MKWVKTKSTFEFAKNYWFLVWAFLARWKSNLNLNNQTPFEQSETVYLIFFLPSEIRDFIDFVNEDVISHKSAGLTMWHIKIVVNLSACFVFLLDFFDRFGKVKSILIVFVFMKILLPLTIWNMSLLNDNFSSSLD